VKFSPPLEKARFIKRYKRFLTDVQLQDGGIVTIHCPNTGSMKNCLVPDSDCWISDSQNPKRKYRYSWEIATTPNRKKAGINTSRANALVVEAINNGTVKELQGYQSLRQEVAYGSEKSRIDILLSDHPRRKQPHCYVEVKNVTYGDDNGQGLFPDAVSDRGRKHLRELVQMVREGNRAVLLYCVQHTGIDCVKPAADIDPAYAAEIAVAIKAGVEVIAYKARLSAREIKLTTAIPFSCF